MIFDPKASNLVQSRLTRLVTLFLFLIADLIVSLAQSPQAGSQQEFNYAEGRAVTFQCPALRVKWEKLEAGSDLRWKTDTYESGDEGGSYLTIPKMLPYHIGTYSCRGSGNLNPIRVFAIQLSASETATGVIGGITITVIVVTLLLVWICMEFFRKAKNGLTKEEIQQFRYGNPEALRGANAYAHENVENIPYNHDLFEIKKENFYVDKTQLLGEGQYGRVMKGRFKGEKVAVKTVKPGVDKMYLKALLGELKVMAHIGSHPNVVKLVGACSQFLRNGELYVILEICELGSLEGYLRKCTSFLNQFTPAGQFTEGKGTYENKATSASAPDQLSEIGDKSAINEEAPQGLTLCTTDILNWALQVARAMEFLSSRKVIHGDLASRNVLLTATRNAKITDFGLSRKLYDYSNYVKKNQEPLPWRWMAIESLRELSFSTLSDVWSYGVTVWEMFALGDVPYPGLSWDNDFIAKLEHNFRLQKPKFASDDIYWNLLLECWRINPSERPTFHVIVGYLEHILAA